MTKSRIVIVNNDDEIIGYKERGTLEETDIYRVAALWIKNSQGDILLAQRKFTKKQDPGKWGPAVAGTVDKGETYDSNIVKEAEEEIGLVDIKPVKGPKRHVAGKYHYFCQWYTLIVNKAAEEFSLKADEVEALKWFARKDLVRELRENSGNFLSTLDWSLNNL